MKAYVEHKQIEPDVEKEVYKLLGNQTPKNIAQKEFEKVVKENTKIQGLKTQAEIEQKVVADQLNVEQKTITSQYEKDYKTLVADLNKESAADPEIETLRKTIIAEDKQTAKQIHEKYQQLVNSGKMTVIQATAARDKEYELFNDPKKLEEKKERINALAKQKFGAKYANAFQQYTNAMNATSTRFNRRYKREAGEIVGLANAKINAELEAVKKQYKTSPETVAKIEAAYKEAYGKVLKEKDLKEYAVDQSLGFWNQIANSTISSFGAGVSGYATTFGLGKVAQLGDVISNNFHPSNISITTAGDWLDPIKAAHGTGDLLGRMVPSILVGAATAAATQGAGVPMAARLMLTGFADMMAESADISGTIYKQMLDKTGSAVDAGNAARDAFEGNLYNYPAYVVGSLPFFKNALKGVPGLTGVFGRTAFGAGLEMVSETYTESVQGAQEKSILAGERLKDTFKELTIDHILETGVQMGPIAILGGAPHLFQGGRDVIEKNFADRAVNAFRAKEVLSTELNDENQAQFFAQIHNEKGAAFAKSMLGSLFIDGKITPEQNERLSTFINNYDNWSPQAKKLGLNGTGAKIGGILFNDLEQARASADPQLIKEAQSAFDNFLKTGNAELISVGLSDGSTYFYKPGEFSRMLDTPDFQKLIQDGSVKLSGMSSNMGTGEYNSLIEKVDMVGKAARPAAPLAPTQEQIEDDIKNKRFATFTYETEDQVPDELKDKINRRGDINGKPFVKVTLPQSQADYILAQQKQAEMEADTEFVTATPEELEAYRNGTLTDQDRIAGINDDALKIEQGAQTLEDLPDDANYREMVKLKLAENQAAATSQQTSETAPLPAAEGATTQQGVDGGGVTNTEEQGVLVTEEIEKTTKALDELELKNPEAFSDLEDMFIDANLTQGEYDNSDLSKAYYQAKADGSNPELVQSVESLLANEAPAAAAPVTEATTETGAAESGRPVIPIELAREFLNIDRLVAKGFVNYVDSKTGKPCAKFGMRDNAFSRGGKWEIVKDLKGYATHEKGGVDLTIDGKGVRIGGPNSKFYAADGLLMPNNGEPVPAQPKPVKKARVYVRENDPVFNSEAKRSLPLLEQKYGKGNVQIIQIPQGNQKLLQAKLAEDLDADTFVYDHSGDDMLGIPVSGAMKNSVDLEDAFDVQNKAMEQSLGRKTTEDEREALYYKMLEKNTDHTGTWTWSFPENYKGCAYWGSCNFDTKASYFTQESKIPSYSTNFDKWHGVNSAVKPLKTDEDFLNQFYFGAKYNYHQPPTEEQ